MLNEVLNKTINSWPNPKTPGWKHSDLRRSHLKHWVQGLGFSNSSSQVGAQPGFSASNAILNIPILDQLKGGGFVFINGHTTTRNSPAIQTLNLPLNFANAAEHCFAEALDFIWEHSNARAYKIQFDKSFHRRDVFVLHYLEEPSLRPTYLDIQVMEGIELRLTEIYLARPGLGFNYPKTQIHLAKKAKLEYLCHVQNAAINNSNDCSDWSHCLQTQIYVNTQAECHVFLYPQATNFYRHELAIHLMGEGAESRFKNLNLSTPGQHLDLILNIHHQAANTKSHTLSRSLVGAGAQASFDGKIKVYEGAQNTDASLSSKFLLLDPSAKGNNSPQFEIYHDQVKCYHGATIGFLEEEALFYLRSRGIPLLEAKKMLAQSFSAPAILEDKISNSALIRNFIEDQLSEIYES
ncbi:MAG: SufD family Fe-S cluster assembly protein [Gammaproteobacteria bacterium]